MICANLDNIRRSIALAAEKAGRNPDGIQLLAVSKRVDAATVKKAWQCGQKLFGENFVQEAQSKIELLDPSISWHFIGHLQSNKAKLAARLFGLIETVDRLKLARSLNRHAAELSKTLDILIQVNVGEERQKSGVLPQNAEQLIREIGELEHLRIRGLMTMPPFTDNPELSRPHFRSLKKIADEFSVKGYFSNDAPFILSMGMSGDYPVAIEEGATLVRVGTAIFGKRA
ncbi:MAG TPA: YggS family pyridoxal phosphate-dependent enzyme [Desulfobacteraceae bacterium]|nr:YggS family pyridoxal phosphate-dependent enzyme [Desulfobacteraceae bacterium]